MRKLIIAIVILISIASCKKAETITEFVELPITCHLNDTSIVGIYKITAIKYKASSTTAEQDYYAGLQNCQKDDTYELKTGGGILFTDAGVSCGLPSGPGSINGWTLENNNSILKMGDDTFNVDSFSCKELIIYQSGVSTTGDKKTTTYTRQ